jgi:uncharacterized FAD-dependent dehydrogenase
LKFDVIVVGAGPAGIFSALELVENTSMKILVLDKGVDLDKRRCPASRGVGCLNCDPCNVLHGWGGAGAFSDGKLTLSTKVGGWLDEYVNEEELKGWVNYVDQVYSRFGAPNNVYGDNYEEIEEVKRKASLAGLRLVPQKVRHMGTEKCSETLRKMRSFLNGKAEVRTESEVKGLMVDGGRVRGVETVDNERILAKYVIAAPGRSGAEWLKCEAQALGLKTLNNPVDVGVRVEVQAPIMEELTDIMYEPKLVYYSKFFDDVVRTFCVAPHGEVITESYNGVLTVNGQSYAERKTGNTNFALLVSTSFTEPFKEPIAYGKYIARLTNLLSGGIIVQRLGDLEAGRRSTDNRISRGTVEPTLKSATPGDLSFVLPYRYLVDIREMLEALDKIAGGVHSRDTLLYGVEVKFYSSRLALNDFFETPIKNLFTVGDGAGLTRGLVQASASGVIAARQIVKRETDSSEPRNDSQAK